MKFTCVPTHLCQRQDDKKGEKIFGLPLLFSPLFTSYPLIVLFDDYEDNNNNDSET